MTVRGTKILIKRLNTQVQQEGPVTLGALPLSITHSSLLGVSEGLIGAQDAGGAQGSAASHSLYIIHKLTLKAGQGLPQNKNCHCVGECQGKEEPGGWPGPSV